MKVYNNLLYRLKTLKIIPILSSKDLLLLKFYNLQKTSEKKVAIDVLKA